MGLEDISTVKEREITIVSVTKTISLRSGFKEDSMEYLIETAKRTLQEVR